MKQLYMFCLMVVFFWGCKKDPAIEMNYSPINTSNVISVSNSTAVVNEFSGGESNATEDRGIIYSTSDNFSNAIKSDENCYFNGNAYNYILRGLTRNKKYYYKAYASDGNEYIYGDIKTFTTKNLPTSVTTEDARYVGWGVNTHLYYYDLSVSVVGVDEVSEFGVQTSASSSFSWYDFHEIDEDIFKCYIEGEKFTFTMLSFGYTDIYYRGYAKLKNGSYIYGSIESI